MDQPNALDLNPRQREIRDLLEAVDVDRPSYPDTLASEIRDHIEGRLAADRPTRAEGDQALWVDKSKLESLHSCEARWAGDEWSGWALPMIHGALTHLAIKRLVMGQYRLIDDPALVVYDALARLRADDSKPGRAEFIDALSDDDRDELAADAMNDLITFITDWPRLPPIWQPSMERKARYLDLFDGDVVLTGRYDLTLWSPTGTTAGRAIVDLKTGKMHASHAAEARFYALLETLRQGVPPFQVGSYYLDTGRLVLEQVTTTTLELAVDRLVDGIRKMWEIQAGRTPTESPSGFCDHCPLYLGCPSGIEFIELRDSA